MMNLMLIVLNLGSKIRLIGFKFIFCSFFSPYTPNHKNSRVTFWDKNKNTNKSVHTECS